MKKLLLIFILWCLINPGLCMADDASDYYILHDTELELKYIPKGVSIRDNITKTIMMKGFKNLCNPNNPIVTCGSEDCRPGMNITFPAIRLEPPSVSTIPLPDYTIYKKFRVFVPPGTTFLNLNIIAKPGKDVRTAVRMNYVPAAGDPANLTYTNQGTYELRYLDYFQVNLQPVGSQISVYNSTPYPIDNSINPLSEDHSGWIYINVLSGVDNIQSINYSFTVNNMVYGPWYSNYYRGQDTHGLDNQSILPMVAAMAGSQLLTAYGQQVTEQALKEVGILFQDESGQTSESSLSTGEGSVIPFGCCKVVCCVGIGIMATPTGVSNAFDGFADAVIDRLDQLFVSANEAFHSYWGLPISMEFKKNRQAYTKLVENQNQVFSDLVTGLGAAQAELKTQEQFGKHSLFDTIYLGNDIAEAVQIQKAAEPLLIKKIYDEFETYRHQFTNPSKIIAHQAQKNNDILTGQTLVASEGTMDPGQIKAAMQMSEILLDPYPELALPEAKKQTSQGKRYTTVRSVKKAQLIISQYLLSENITEQAPTVSAETVNKIRSSMGYTGDPLAQDSRLSSKAFMELLVDCKFANPNWYTEGADKNYYGLSREGLVLKAFSLEQELHMLFKLHRQTLLKAQIYAAQITHKMNPELNQAFKDAVSK